MSLSDICFSSNWVYLYDYKTLTPCFLGGIVLRSLSCLSPAVSWESQWLQSLSSRAVIAGTSWGHQHLRMHVLRLLSNQWLVVWLLQMLGMWQQQDPFKLNHSCLEYTWFAWNWLSQQLSQGGNHQGVKIGPCLRHNTFLELGRCWSYSAIKIQIFPTGWGKPLDDLLGFIRAF